MRSVMMKHAAALSRVSRALKEVGSPATDRQLLRQFAAAGDQEAFATLVRRHTGLVLGVCRRALPTTQDAEDACQATFLILARKAGGRWQESVANWLFATARRVASSARRTAQRRERRERRAAVPDAVAPLDRLSGREMLAVIDEELARLPPLYREPLVLHYLEELARDEIAARLNVPVGTVKTRLERGRKKLGDALTRRGVMLGAGLMALAVTSRAGASPSRLVQDILSTVSGRVPVAVAELAQGVAVNGFINKLMLGLVAASAVAVLGAITTSAADRPAEKALSAVLPRSPRDDRNAKPPPTDSKTTTVSGRVLDPEGKPLKGAKLFLQGGEQPTEAGTSGDDGRFTVSVPAEQSRAFLVARGEGVGLDFVNLAKVKPDGEVELRMSKDHPIHGRVVDTEGKPVAGATVATTQVSFYADNSLDSFLTQWKKREPHSGLPAAVKSIWPNVGSGLTATTDKDGRFTLSGLGAERLVTLRVQGAGIAESQLWVVTRDGFDPKPYNQESTDKSAAAMAFGYGPAWLLHGPTPAVVAEAEKPIRGVVKDVDTGKPRAGVKVSLTRAGRELLRVRVTATTDAEGRFTLRGSRKLPSYMLEVPSDPGTGHMAGQVRVADTAGYEPIVADIAVKKGVVITGKVIDAATKQPLPGYVTAGVAIDNPFVKEYPEFMSSAWIRTERTGDDGVFRLVTLPGPVVLMGGPDSVRMPDGPVGRYKYKPPVPDPKYPQYFQDLPGHSAVLGPGGVISPLQGSYCKVIETKPGTEVVTHDIVVERAAALEVLVRDADGKPVEGFSATGISPEDWHAPIRFDKDVCSAYHLEAGKPRLMVFFEAKRKLFGTLALKGDEKEPAVVKLAPGATVKGRVLDEDGKPLAGVVVGLYHPDRTAEELGEHVHRETRIETDADGKFVVADVIPGVKFKVSFVRGRKTFEPVDKIEDREAKPGETLDVGSLRLKPRPGGNQE